MSRCNYCRWERMKRDKYRIATSEERRRLWEEQGNITDGGVVVVNEKGEFAAWFMELPKRCCC